MQNCTSRLIFKSRTQQLLRHLRILYRNRIPIRKRRDNRICCTCLSFHMMMQRKSKCLLAWLHQSYFILIGSSTCLKHFRGNQFEFPVHILIRRMLWRCHVNSFHVLVQSVQMIQIQLIHVGWLSQPQCIVRARSMCTLRELHTLQRMSRSDHPCCLMKRIDQRFVP